MIHVTCAIIVHNDKILICQRSEMMSMPLKWEFPGGKIEPGESNEECLRREIREELGVEISIGKSLKPVVHKYPSFSICLYPFVCALEGGEMILAEHVQALWVPADVLMDYDWAEADVPVVNAYLEFKLS